MKKTTLQALSLVLLVAAVLATALTLPASAELHRVTVRMPDGTVQQVVVDARPGATLQDIRSLVQGEPVAVEPVPPQTTPQTQTQQAPAPAPAQPAPAPQSGPAQAPAPAAPAGPQELVDPDAPRAVRDRRKRQRTWRKKDEAREKVVERKAAKPNPRPEPEPGRRRPQTDTGSDLRNADGSPTRTNPGFVDALPGPSTATGVPNFIIRKFRVPVFLLPIYQAAGIEYGVRWEILAAINEIETDYGRNLNVSSAGALGWMQFMPATWKMYGTDGNKDGRKDPYNPVDAIFAAARYLKAAGYEKDVRRAVFAYNHADWYVDSVMLRARLIAGVPADLVGSLTGLTEGRFPVYARARYADDLKERDALKKVKAGENAANVIEDSDKRRGVEIFARKGAPVVATNDGVIKKVGRNKRLGRYVVLQDVYGNRFTYGHLGSVARYYPVPKDEGVDEGRSVEAIAAADREPTAPASAGRQPEKKRKAKPARRKRSVHESQDAPAAQPAVKRRLFAHPGHKLSEPNGGLEQLLEHEASQGGFETFKTFFSRPFGVDGKNVRFRKLRKGARVIGGTILGRIGPSQKDRAAHLLFEIRPAGRGAPRIDPKPILDGWKLLEATRIYGRSGRNALRGEGGASVGQIMMMSKPLLEKRVLGDERIEIYDAGRTDIRSGQVDRRVLATLAYLAETGFRPTVTSLKAGHGFLTASGNVSHHSSGNAVDIAKVNGVPIMGHQQRGGITEQTVRQIMRLQGTMRPDQIISLLELGGNTVAMGDHADHIHVGFRPRFGANRKLGKQAFQVLKPGQWSDLVDRLGEIENPVVPTAPSKYSIPVPGEKGRKLRAAALPTNPRELRPLGRLETGGDLRPLDSLGR